MSNLPFSSEEDSFGFSKYIEFGAGEESENSGLTFDGLTLDVNGEIIVKDKVDPSNQIDWSSLILQDAEAQLRLQIAEKETIVASQAEQLRKTAEELRKTNAALKNATALNSETETDRQHFKETKQIYLQTVEKQKIDIADLRKQKDLGYLLDRVCAEAAQLLLKDPAFVKSFEETKQCRAHVLSIDIRRSTDLMLRGKTPELYAAFLNNVCSRLGGAVKAHFGVIDKFTGDGLLAYFPEFFSGKDAGYRALAAAQECHEIFTDAYRTNRDCFTVALKDVGLGIGIDFGEVHLLRVTNELTVVGAPVVYACRLSGAPAGKTYMNHSAAAELEKCKTRVFEAKEVEFMVKNEGVVICYDASIIHTRYEPSVPNWIAPILEKPIEERVAEVEPAQNENNLT